MKIISLYSIKGGVGKTSACVNLAYLSASEGHATLICDLDPQGAASYYFRIKPSKKQTGKKIIRRKKILDRYIKGTDFQHLDLLPAHISYRNLDIILDRTQKSKTRLRKLLLTFRDEYDYIFLDCPPNITLVSENIFQASHHILVPIIPTSLSILAYINLGKFFRKHRYDSDKLLPFFSMVEKRKKMHTDIMSEYSLKFTPSIKSMIPYSADIEKMGLQRKPVLVFQKKSPASRAYQNLWKELKDYLI
ncbi:MAG: ParA family protein [bacterium]|nr:MAG: ParA family protein [bacterium]